MTFLPIVARELRVASRRRGTYWWRIVAALAAIVLGTWFFIMMQRDMGARQMAGLILFGILTGSTVLYALLNGMQATVDCLSSEKRDGTLGLLFLTDLKGYDVVLGKLAAASLRAFYGVVAVVPMLAIPLMMGGVTLGEVGRMALVAVNTLFLSLAIGLAASAMSRSAARAIPAAFALLIFFSAALPACAAWLDYRHMPGWTRAVCLFPSPGFGYWFAFDSQYRVFPRLFWISMVVIHGLGWFFLILASLITPRTWQDKPATVRTLRWRERWRQWSYGDVGERRAYRRRLLDANAFFWLAARSRLKPACVWGLLGLLACAWVWALVKWSHDWFIEPFHIMTGILLNSLLKNWVAAESCRQLSEERSQGALELLLSTPLSVRDILRGQLLALRRQFLGPLLAVLAANFFFMMTVSPRLLGSDWRTDEDQALWIGLWTAGMVMLVVDLVALFWVGMWQGLKARSPNLAVRGTQARILVLPWTAFALMMLIVALANSHGGNWPGWKFWLFWWLTFGLAADLGFGLWARQRLLTDFRAEAAERYAPHVRQPSPRLEPASTAPGAGPPVVQAGPT